MFQFYGRSETSFACAMGIAPHSFAVVKERGWAVYQQELFPRHIHEGEFVLLIEINARGEPTGDELTLFANIAKGARISFDVVGEPDEHWEWWKGIDSAEKNNE